MPHLEELDDYKRVIVNKLLRDKEFVSLVTLEDEPELPAKVLLNRQVFLYDYLDNTVTDDKVFVCVDCDDDDTVNCAVGKFVLHIWVAVPKSLMNMNGKIRRDALVSRIDRLINGSTEFGFGKLTRRAGGRFQMTNTFRCRVLNYTVEDWNRHNTTL